MPDVFWTDPWHVMIRMLRIRGDIWPRGKGWCWGLLVAVSTAAAVACATDPTSVPELSPETSTPVETATSVPSPLPTSTPAPTPSPSPTVNPTAQGVPSETPVSSIEATPTLTPPQIPSPTPLPPGIFPDAPDRDLYELARSLLLKTDDPIPRVVNPQPVSLPQGSWTLSG